MTTQWTVGDTAPALTGELTSTPYNSTTASPVDLTTAASATVIIHKPDGTTISRAANSLGGAAGTFTFLWQAGDLSVDGIYYFVVRVVWADGTIETFGVGHLPVVAKLG